MSPESVTYVQKVIGISGVQLRGKAEYRDIDPKDRDAGGAWFVGTDNLEEWIEKFDGKHVYVEIKTYERDESHLLPVNEPLSPNA